MPRSCCSQHLYSSTCAVKEAGESLGRMSRWMTFHLSPTVADSLPQDGQKRYKKVSRNHRSRFREPASIRFSFVPRVLEQENPLFLEPAATVIIFVVGYSAAAAAAGRLLSSPLLLLLLQQQISSLSSLQQ